MKNEYIVWGIPKGDKLESVLYTKSNTLEEAQYMARYLEDTYKVIKTRVQIIDFSKPLEDSFKNPNLINT